MARSAGFWGWYAEANDSAEKELISKGWFGQNHGETPMQDALKEPHPAQPDTGLQISHEPPSHEADFEAVYGQEMEQEQEL